MKRPEEPKNAADIANEIKAKNWNECVVPRLESVRAWLSVSDWTEGLAPWLRQSRDQLVTALIQGNSTLTFEQTRFLAGQIAMCNEILALPDTILTNIMEMDRNKAEAEKRQKSIGNAGY